MRSTGLTVGLHRDCVRVLMRCREFSERSTLETVFTIEPLTRYAEEMPYAPRSKKDLVEITIGWLFGKADGRPLLDLLIVLRDKRDEDDSERDELDALHQQVSFYLTTLPAKMDGEGEGDEVENGQKESAKYLRAELRDYHLGNRESAGNSDFNAPSWITSVYDKPEEWAFRIALVVFNGAPWELCMAAALDLGGRLPPPNPPSTDNIASAPAVATPQRNPLTLLSEAGGHLESVDAFRVVKLGETHRPREILDFVWDEFTRRPLLTEWLSDLAISGNPTNRIRAAVASGLLMLSNFDNIQRQLYWAWAHRTDKQSFYRAAIGRALGVVAEEGSRLGEMRNLLKQWSASSDRAMRWAAARAYLYVGWRYSIDEVIARWRLIAEAEDIPTLSVRVGETSGVLINSLHTSLLDAMEKFFLGVAEMTDVRQAIFSGALSSFKAWADETVPADEAESVDDDDDSIKATVINFGVLMFIKLARILASEDGPPRLWPPILLTLLEPEKGPSRTRKCIVDMFERMLRDPAAQPTVLELLRSWIERVERNPRYEAQMGSILDDLLARDEPHGKLRRLLAVELGLWSPRSRFPLHEPHPELTHLQRVVLVVDLSQSALPYWDDVKSIAQEFSSAFSDCPALQIYCVNSAQEMTFAWLDEFDPYSEEHQLSQCSLIAPVITGLELQSQQIDALIMIGNGEIFDLADWAGHPLIDRWITVRVGPDSMVGNTFESDVEITSDSLSTVYDRVLAPPTPTAPHVKTIIHPGDANGQWRVDRSGYPMVYVKPLRSYLHLFPVSKVQFERFIAAEPSAGWRDDEYGKLLDLNPRRSIRAADYANYEGLFLTGIKPNEAQAFGNWLGSEYEIPEAEQWLICYEWLEQTALADPPSGLAEDALAIWKMVLGRQSIHSLLDLSLMREGVKEWVKVKGKVEKHSGLGCPSPRFPTLNRDPRSLTHVISTEERNPSFGFRLLAR